MKKTVWLPKQKPRPEEGPPPPPSRAKYSPKKAAHVSVEGNDTEIPTSSGILPNAKNREAKAKVGELSASMKAINTPQSGYSHFISFPLAFHSVLTEKVTKFQESVLEMVGYCESEDKLPKSQELGDETDISTELGKGKPVENKELEEEFSADGKDGMDILMKNKEARTSRSRCGIDKSIFIKPATFHLTVLMLQLWTDDRVMEAAETLQKALPKVLKVLDGRPLSVRLKGVESMQEKHPEKTNVVYAKVEETEQECRLVRACHTIIDEFIKAGFVLEKDIKMNKQIKLHATLMNTSHRKGSTRMSRRIPFDARKILSKYGGYDWGDYIIPAAHLSQISAHDENGYYRCFGSIDFPSS